MQRGTEDEQRRCPRIKNVEGRREKKKKKRKKEKKKKKEREKGHVEM